jgi:hypothetical protein
VGSSGREGGGFNAKIAKGAKAGDGAADQRRWTQISEEAEKPAQFKFRAWRIKEALKMEGRR